MLRLSLSATCGSTVYIKDASQGKHKVTYKLHGPCAVSSQEQHDPE